MDAELYSEAIQYEQLTQAVYQAILQNEGVKNVDVQHNVNIAGRSGVLHQIDVLWKFKRASIEHTVLIECKNYASSLTLEKVRNFFAVVHDIGNAQGLMVTKTGYQSGAAEFANYYGLGLKLLRKPNNSDWEGRIKDIHLHLTAKSVVSSEDKPLTTKVFISPIDTDQEARLNTFNERGGIAIPNGADVCFLDANGNIATEEMRWWLPRQLKTLDKEDGGPYSQKIELNEKYISVNIDGKEELVRVIGLEVTYFVESYSQETVSHGEELVEAILKDYNTGTTEHVKRS